MRLKIGQKLWIGSYPLLSYEVTGVIQREKNVQYEVKCLDCDNRCNGACLILIRKDEYGKLVFAGMVNEDEDTYEPRHYWHKTGNFFITKKEAVFAQLDTYISEHKEKIERAKKDIEYSSKQIGKYEEVKASFIELTSNPPIAK